MAQNRSNTSARVTVWFVACVAAVLLAGSPTGAAADDKIKELVRSMGVIELKLVEASVPDLDPLPMQKDSDVFVRVYLNDTKELLCETKVVQDENKPKVSLFLGFCFFWALFGFQIRI